MTRHQELIQQLREKAQWRQDVHGDLHTKAADEIDRLQRIIDSRPAINAGLPESYIKWSQNIYWMEYSRATQTPS